MEVTMNKVLLDVLTDKKLRQKAQLKKAVVNNTSAGMPWLTGLDKK